MSVATLGSSAGQGTLHMLAVVAGCLCISVCVFGGYAALFSMPSARRIYARIQRVLDAGLALVFGAAGRRGRHPAADVALTQIYRQALRRAPSASSLQIQIDADPTRRSRCTPTIPRRTSPPRHWATLDAFTQIVRESFVSLGRELIAIKPNAARARFRHAAMLSVALAVALAYAFHLHNITSGGPPSAVSQ